MDLKEIEKKIDPYRLILASLIILVIINAPLQGVTDTISSAIIAVAISVGLDTGITYFKTKKVIWSYGPAISGLILTLVFSPNLPLYYIAATAVLAQVLKHIIRYNNNNIFNPASLAMIIVFLFVPAEVWWGNKLYEALILGLLVSWRIKRLPASITFMIAYMVFSIFIVPGTDVQGALDLALAWVFLAFFMLVEPRTSPRSLKAQVIYGALVALIAVVGFAQSWHSPILLGLLIGNAATAFFLSKLK